MERKGNDKYKNVELRNNEKKEKSIQIDKVVGRSMEIKWAPSTLVLMHETSVRNYVRFLLFKTIKPPSREN